MSAVFKQAQMSQYNIPIEPEREMERAFLACLFRDPEWLAEVKDIIKPDFFAKSGKEEHAHQKIYSMMLALQGEFKSFDKHLLINRLNLVGLKNVGGVDIEPYILDVLCSMSIDEKARAIYFEEFCKVYYLRQTWANLENAQTFLKNNRGLPLQEVIDGVTKLSVEAITLSAVAGTDEGFTDINGDMEDLINEGVGRQEDLGLPSPFPTFNRWYGQFMVGGLYVFAASSKVGKSTFLSALTDHFVEVGRQRKKGGVKILVIDTEMTKREVACRKMAAKSGVNAFYYLNGKFAENKEHLEKTQHSFEEFKQDKGTVYHYYLPAADSQKIESIAKRFHAKHVGPDDIFVCQLDYLKFSGNEDRTGGGGQALKEYELIGIKTDLMKQLAEKLPRTISITAIQTNRDNDIAQADRVKWYVSGLHTLSRKTPEEIGEEKGMFGSHKMKMVVVRNLGEFAEESGPIPAARGNETVWVENWLNLDFSNFRVIEKGTRKDVIEKLGSAGQLTPKSASEKNSQTYKKYSKP